MELLRLVLLVRVKISVSVGFHPPLLDVLSWFEQVVHRFPRLVGVGDEAVIPHFFLISGVAFVVDLPFMKKIMLHRSPSKSSTAWQFFPLKSVMPLEMSTYSASPDDVLSGHTFKRPLLKKPSDLVQERPTFVLSVCSVAANPEFMHMLVHGMPPSQPAGSLPRADLTAAWNHRFSIKVKLGYSVVLFDTPWVWFNVDTYLR